MEAISERLSRFPGEKSPGLIEARVFGAERRASGKRFPGEKSLGLIEAGPTNAVRQPTTISSYVSGGEIPRPH